MGRQAGTFKAQGHIPLILTIILFPAISPSRLAHRGRRRSRRLMTEQGAVPDNGIAVEPREAQRPTSLGARTPQAATPGNGDIAVGARRADRKARQRAA